MWDCLKLNLGSFCHLMMNDWADPAREPGRNVPLLSRFGALKEADSRAMSDLKAGKPEAVNQAERERDPPPLANIVNEKIFGRDEDDRGGDQRSESVV